MIHVIAGEASCRVCGGGYQVWRTTCWCHQVCGGWHLFIMFTIYWSDSRSVVEDLKVRVKPSVDIVIGDIQDQVKPAVEKVVDNLKENVSVKIDSKENTHKDLFLQLRSWFSSFDTEGFFWDINGQFWKPSLYLISITLLLVNKYVENIYLYYFLLSILWTELQLVVARGFGDWAGQWGWGGRAERDTGIVITVISWLQQRQQQTFQSYKKNIYPLTPNIILSVSDDLRVNLIVELWDNDPPPQRRQQNTHNAHSDKTSKLWNRCWGNDG